MRHLLHAVIPLAAVLVTAVVMTLACSGRPVDSPEEDFTEAVERICADYCSMNLDCREPAAFGGHDECMEVCRDAAFVYDDTTCGEARRDVLDCAGSQPTCELYNDTNNVHADDYTCKAEKDRYIGLDCGQSSEEP